ncbi:MAG: hypothetical protein HY295_04105 [Thaumarchaeota archaeon]|nr:hypothetical protein [Nitrososphaerota archaeon]
MWEQNKKSNKLKVIILIAMISVFIPFTVAWYDLLTNFDCKELKSHESNRVKIGSMEDKQQNCYQETNSHWFMFYSVNGIIYGSPLLALILKVKNNKN